MQRAFRSFASLSTLSLLAAAALFSGCASHVNSPRAAKMRADKAEKFSHPLIARAYHAAPAMRFPASIGLAPQDANTQAQLRALDAAGKLDALKSLPRIKETVNVSSLVMADSNSDYGDRNGEPVAIWNKSDLVLREAGAKLHTDAILLMKIETTVTDGTLFAPLTVISLGMFPNDRVEVIATALAALVDTRTGYVYATAERSAGKTGISISWDSDLRERIENAASRKAMEKLFGEFPAVWRGVVAKHSK